MSLFKSIEWWSALHSSDEECDFGCLCVGDITNAHDGSEQVAVGNYAGLLRIYSPSKDNQAAANDLLLESKLAGPILQLASGRYVSVSKDVHLAVLQPRSISVYSIDIKKGAVDHGNQAVLNKVYEHKLERTSANFTSGPFGGVREKELICVQSMDGTISIFDSENFVFMRFIPGFGMPGPLAYCAGTDSFLTVSSNRQLESYSYQVLAVAASSKTKEESQSVTSGKRIKVDWQLSLGECALDIRVVTIPSAATVIMVLGERNLYCVEESGQLKYMKKLGYSPACFHPYVPAESSSVNCVVATHSKQLLVYEGIIVKWATLVDDVPVHVCLGNISGNEGLIVTLTDSCRVSCNYLGTHPSIFSLPRSNAREMDQSAIDKEMLAVNDRIRKLHSTKKDDIISKNRDNQDIKVKIDMPPTIDRVSVSGPDAPPSVEGQVPSITVQIMLKALRRVNNVSVMIHVDDPLTCTQNHISIPSIDPLMKAESDPIPCMTVSFFLGKEFSPASLKFEVVVHYQQSGSGNPRVVTAAAELPITLVSWPHDPIKTMQHKVTLESNVRCVNLLDLFPELTSADAGPHCVGLKLIHGATATILTSKSSNRYRVQSDAYQGLWLVTKDLLRRIQNYSTSHKITHPQPVTIDEIYPVMDRHFQLRMSRLSVHQLLDQRAKQFRAIQRRLLTRFKDKTPRPLNCLDTLLEGTYRQIQALANACGENAYMLLMSNVELLCALRLVILLTKLALSLSDKESELLESVLCINLRDADMGWEETVETSISALLNSALSKRGKGDEHRVASTAPPEIPNDISKLKDSIKTMFDRLASGKRLILSSSHESDAGPISNISVGHPSMRGDKKLNFATTRGGIGEEPTTQEDVDNEAFLADILKSTPVSSVPRKGQSDILKPPSELEFSELQTGDHSYNDPKPPKSPDIDSSMSNLSLNALDGEEIRDLKPAVTDEPSISVSKQVIGATEDPYGADEDLIESSSFFDNTADDTYAM